MCDPGEDPGDSLKGNHMLGKEALKLLCCDFPCNCRRKKVCFCFLGGVHACLRVRVFS